MYNTGDDTNRFIQLHVCICVYNAGDDTNKFIRLHVCICVYNTDDVTNKFIGLHLCICVYNTGDDTNKLYDCMSVFVCTILVTTQISYTTACLYLCVQYW